MSIPLEYCLQNNALYVYGSKSFINRNKIKALDPSSATFDKANKTWIFEKPSITLIETAKKLVKSVNEYYHPSSKPPFVTVSTTQSFSSCSSSEEDNMVHDGCITKMEWVQEVAQNLFREHQMDKKGWTFGFNNTKASAGVCKYHVKQICISKHFIRIRDEASILNTIRHEVAHSLAGPDAKHSQAWKDIFIKLGGDGKRCCQQFVRGKYLLTCANNCFVLYRHRRCKLENKKCKKCGLLPFYMVKSDTNA